MKHTRSATRGGGAMALGALLVLACVAGTSMAQQRAPAADPARIAAAKELFIASGQDAQFDTVINAVTRNLGGLFKQQQPGHGRTIDEVTAAMAAKFIARKSEMMDAIAPLYAERFTVAELAEVTAFYRTPVGRKLTATQPEIMQQSMQLGMQWGQRIGHEVEQGFRRELKSRGVPI